MSTLKTQPNDQSVESYIEKITPNQRRADCQQILDLMYDIVKVKPVMWGDSIVGFGTYHYKYASGREGDWFLAGFASRKQSITIYLMNGVEKQSELLARLGKWKAGKGCLYIKRLSDINVEVLKEVIQHSVEKLKEQNQ